MQEEKKLHLPEWREEEELKQTFVYSGGSGPNHVLILQSLP